MATLIKFKKTPIKLVSKTKIHSLANALGAIKEKVFSLTTKSRREIWER